MMCETVIENSNERKCFKQTLIIIDKSIDKGNELLEKLIKKITESEPNHENFLK